VFDDRRRTGGRLGSLKKAIASRIEILTPLWRVVRSLLRVFTVPDGVAVMFKKPVSIALVALLIN
jgi:hypothetical protein